MPCRYATIQAKELEAQELLQTRTLERLGSPLADAEDGLRVMVAELKALATGELSSPPCALSIGVLH